MKHLIVYAHPRPRSFNRAIVDTVAESKRKEGHEVVVRDLYEIGFQPALGSTEMLGGVEEDVSLEQSYVSWADHVTFIYPLWWMGMPAVLKGYVDRVFSYGFAHKYVDGVQTGLLKGKTAALIHTQNKSQEEYEASGMEQSMRLTIDKGIFEYCGFEVTRHFVFDSILSSTAEERKNWFAMRSH
ncbi:NAD(P)H-dependent oxidoreductase [Cohnella soli]|uniref:NAD(P)H-dependent oxidoreductase n=1 Tax=Cohnella soli TaxID=425005 RepID=A0ABW0I1Q0_9BACL